MFSISIMSDIPLQCTKANCFNGGKQAHEMNYTKKLCGFGCDADVLRMACCGAAFFDGTDDRRDGMEVDLRLLFSACRSVFLYGFRFFGPMW